MRVDYWKFWWDYLHGLLMPEDDEEEEEDEELDYGILIES